MKTYSKNNFHKHTFCLWQEVPLSEIENLDKNHSSKSGSDYIFIEKGVYRISNHWGRVSNCRWKLVSTGNYKNQQIKVGFASWNNFFPNDETSKLYYIQVDFKTKGVDFFHKNDLNYGGKSICRTANETSKTIKTIKEILTETSWSNYLKFNDLEVLRNEIINELIFTDKNFLEIKKNYF